MKVHKEKTWQHVTTGVDGNARLFGVNIFDYEWERMGKSVEVTDPLYGQKYRFSVYKVMIDNKEYEFAAGEFSNCIYGFFVQKY